MIRTPWDVVGDCKPGMADVTCTAVAGHAWSACRQDTSGRGVHSCLLFLPKALTSHASSLFPHRWTATPSGSCGCAQTNGKLQSSDPDVFVAGDLANFPLPRYGGQRFRQEHVQNARESAAHAVSAILKPAETGDYDYLPVSPVTPLSASAGHCVSGNVAVRSC